MSQLRLRAPAKINWSLEVLHKRTDGYHEVRTVLQTIELSDWLTLTPHNAIALSVTGEAGPLAGQPLDANLAYRAAALLRRKLDRDLGARIELEKRIPVAAGLGGGSSDAAAVLRGLRALWRLDISDGQLAAIAAALGSDVPFFLRGGCALAGGRGDVLAPLPDPQPLRLLLAWPPHPAATDKTARMYAALRKEDFTDGSRTELVAEHLRVGRPMVDQGIFSTFERVLPLVDAALARTLEEMPVARGPHLCGSGPAVFFLLEREQPSEPLRLAIEGLGLRVAETRTLSSDDALAVEELP